MEKELLTTKEAAELLRVSPSTIASLRAKGGLPFVQLGRKVLFKRETLMAYVTELQTTN